jgi:hypothetical protein
MAAAAVLAVTALCFGSLPDNDFTNWDDHKYILENPLIRTFSWENTRTIFSSYLIGDYNPLSVSSFAVDYALFGLKPAGYHVTNLLLHLANTALVLFFSFFLSGKIAVSLILALLFGIHPLHVEPVAWTAGRGWLLSTFFYLLTLISYLFYRERGQIYCYLAALVLFTLSLFSKSMGLTLPFVLLLLDYYRHRRLDTRAIVEKVPFLVLSICFALIVMFVRDTAEHATAQPITSLLGNLLTAIQGTIFYLLKTVAPFQLSSFYSFPKAVYLLNPVFLLKLLLFIVLLVIVLFTVKRRRAIFFGAFFFLVTMLPFSQIIRFGVTPLADRYMYLPSIGLFFLAGLAFEASYFRPGPYARALKRLVTLIVCAMFLFLGILSHRRTDVWQNSVSLWEDASKANPDHPIVGINLGNAYTEQGRLDEAIAVYQELLIRWKKNTRILLNLGVAYSKKGETEKAISLFQQILSRDPGHAKVRNLLGAQYASQGRFEAAIREFKKSLSFDPEYGEAYYNWGVALREMGKYGEAERRFRKAEDLGFQRRTLSRR